MNCEIYDDVLDDYVDGARASDRPGDVKFAAFEEHLAGCERCQALVADFSSIRRKSANEPSGRIAGSSTSFPS